MNYVKVSREVRGSDGNMREAHSVQCNRGEDTCHVVTQRDGNQKEGEITKGELEGLVREAVISMLPQKRGIPDLRAMLAQELPHGLAQELPHGLAQGLPQGLAQGLPQGLAQGLPQGLAQGLAQGLLHPSAPYGLPDGISHDLVHNFEEDEPCGEESEEDPVLQPLSHRDLEGLLTEASQMKGPSGQNEQGFPCEYSKDTATTQLEKYMKGTEDTSTSFEAPVTSSPPKVVAIQPEQLQKLIASLQPMEGVFA